MLYEFYGQECPHCQRMRKLTNRLMQEYPEVEIIRKEVWHNTENMDLVKSFDAQDACGGIPFFYNTETKKWLCGEVSYEQIKTWAEITA